jgi:hypothetical protein
MATSGDSHMAIDNVGAGERQLLMRRGAATSSLACARPAPQIPAPHARQPAWCRTPTFGRTSIGHGHAEPTAPCESIAGRSRS